MTSIDQQIRLAAFEWLHKVAPIQDFVLTREQLQNGFIFQDLRIPFVSPKGIHTPKHMEFPLTITTAPIKKYEDSISDQIIIYKYRGEDVNHPDNAGLRNLMKENTPLIYLLGIVPGKYLVNWPVYIVNDDPSKLNFIVGLDDYTSVFEKKEASHDLNLRRMYATRTIFARLHQRSFREKILYAYRNQCSLCKLRHNELLDAAHIIGDKEELGEPIISNGIALCKLHHAAFDSYIIGINTDFKITVREDILEEIDGPMLQYGLKNLNNNKLILPQEKKNWPNRDLLEIKYQRFANF